MSDPNQRGLTTEHGKKLFLHPKELGISEEEKGNFLTLEDDIGVRLESSKKIEITAKGNITLIGKQVQFETPVEINLASMNQINPSKSTKKEKMNTTTMPSLSPLTPFSSTGSTQVDFHLLSNTTQASSIDEDNLPEILLFMHWTSDPPRHPEKEYYVTSAGKDYAVMRSLMSAISFGDKAYDWLSEWLMDVEIVTAKDMENAVKNFIGNVNNVYSILDSAGAIRKFVEWEKVPNVVKKGKKWATNASAIITLLFVTADTIKEIFNDYDTAYIVDFIFGREMLADDKETALVKYVYAYQEIKNLVKEGKIIYKIGIFGTFDSIWWKQEDEDEIIENLELIGSMT